MNVIGYNPNEIPGGDVGDGIVGRLVDPYTGGGVMNPNLNPSVVGVDPLTGVEAEEGTDMLFSAPVHAQRYRNLINGDFAVGPPDPSADLSDTNVLPGWTFVDLSNGRITARWSGGDIVWTMTNSLFADEAYIQQRVRVPASDARAYTMSPTCHWASAGGGLIGYKLWAQYEQADGTAVGTAASETADTVTGLRAYPDTDGRVPADATYLRVRVGIASTVTSSSTRTLTETAADHAPAADPAGIYGVRRLRTAVQSIPNNTDTAIDFTAASTWDSDAFDDLGTDTVEIQAPGSGGYYLVQAGCEFASNATGFRELWIEHNGIARSGTVVQGARMVVPAASGIRTALSVSGMFKAAPLDFFSVGVRQTSGGALDVDEIAFAVTRIAGG